jgi:MFS family permease
VGKTFRQARLHYAWIVAGVTFLVLLVTAGIFATPGVLMVPLEAEFGWTSAAISTAIAINLALFGLIGPFAASLMDRWGLRGLVLCALLLLAASVGLTMVMKSQWQLVLLWGVGVGSQRLTSSIAPTVVDVPFTYPNETDKLLRCTHPMLPDQRPAPVQQSRSSLAFLVGPTMKP